MSTTVDNRVLEMQFDNAQFEKGVATSMSTLDKLKQKLNLSGASKGLEEVSKSAKNVDMSGLSRGIETVNAKFSAMQVIGTTALVNITNSAMRAGKRMISSLTIDPVKTGFSEYETQLNAVQTILANTREEGTNVQDVNKALDELNLYADKTIYNFTEMTRNIGTFTAAGVKMWDSVDAIKGIANLAAVSGSTSQQASTAMYQLSQALAAGKVNLMDWNSVVHAGMGGKIFQNALIRTSELLGTGAQAALDTYGTFRESLTKSGWLTTEVLTETLKQISGAYTEADLLAQGYSQSQAKEIMALAKDAEDAATKVKTFTQLWDVLKEAAQSGWAQTWRAIFGDFEEARSFWTEVSNVLTNIIGKFNDFRNNIVEGAMGKTLESIFGTSAKAIDAVEEVTESLVNLDEIVGKVINGDFGNGQVRYDKLTEMGINWMRVQNRVNETLNNSHRYTEEQIAAQDKLIGKQNETAESTGEVTKSQVQLDDTTKEHLKSIHKIIEATDDHIELSKKLRQYTTEEVTAVGELEKVAEELGVPFEDLIDNIDNLSGRFFLLNGIKNIGRAIAKTFSAIAEGWQKVFGVFDSESAIDGIFNAMIAFSQFTASLIPTEEEAKNLSRIFAGLFAAIDLVTDIIGGGFKFALSIVRQVLGAFDLDLLDVLATVGDAVVAFRDWVEEHNILSAAISGIIDKLPSLVGGIKEWFDAFKELGPVKKLTEAINNIRDAITKLADGDISLADFAKSLGSGLAEILKSLVETAAQFGKDFVAGFILGLTETIGEVITKVFEFCSNFISGFAEALGIHSPSVIAYDYGVNWVQGFINGVESMLQPVIDALQPIIDAVKKVFSSFWEYITDDKGDVEWDKVISGGMAIESLVILNKFANSFQTFADALSSFSGIFLGVKKVLFSFSKVVESMKWDIKARALLKLAISIGVLAAAVWVIAQIDDIGKLWNAVGVIAVLTAIMFVLAWSIDRLNAVTVKWDKGPQIEGIKSGLIQIGIAMLLLAATVKIISGIPMEEAKQGFLGLASLAVGMMIFIAVIGGISRYSKDIDQIGTMMLKLSIALGLMVVVFKMVGMLSDEDLGKGIFFVTGLGIFVIALVAVAKGAGEHISKVGGMLIKLSIAMALLVGVCKLVNLLSPAEMLKGAAFAVAFAFFVGILVAVTTIASDQKIAKIGGLVLSISTGLMLMAGVCKIVGKLSEDEIETGMRFIVAIMALISTFVLILNVASDRELGKVAGTLLAFGIAVGILAGVSIILGVIDTAQLAKGVAAVSILCAMMSLMVHQLQWTNEIRYTMTAMAIAIGVMAAAVVVLSNIDPKDLVGPVAAMSALMYVFSLMIKATGNAKSAFGAIILLTLVVAALAGILYFMTKEIPSYKLNNILKIAGSISLVMLAMAASLKAISGVSRVSKSTMKTIGILTLVVAGIGLVLGLMAALIPVDRVNSLIPATAALSVLLLAMSAAVVVLDQAHSISKSTMKTIGILTAVVAGIGLVLGLMASLIPADKVSSLIPAAAALSVLLLAMSAAVVVLDQAHRISKSAMTTIGILTAVVAGIGLVLGLMAALIPVDRVNTLIPAAAALSVLLVSMSAAALILSQISPIASASLTGAAGMMAIVLVVGAILIAVAALVGSISGAEQALDGAVMVFGKIGEMIGSLVGGVIETLGESVCNTIENFGTSFKNAMTSLKEASEAATGIDGSSFSGVSDLLSTLMDIGLTMVGTSFTDIFTLGGNGMSKFVTDGKAFFEGMSAMSEAAMEINPLGVVKMSYVVPIGQALSDLQGSLTGMDGVFDWLTGKSDLGTFGQKISEFVLQMVIATNAAMRINPTGAVNLALITPIAQALADLQGSLEPMDKFFDWLTGKSDLTTFGQKISEFVDQMVVATESANDIDATGVENMGKVASIAQALADLQATIEPIGGLMEQLGIIGKDDLASFGANITLFMIAMKIAANAAADISATGMENMTAVTTVAQSLSTLQNSIEPIGGVAKELGIIGKDDLASFGVNIAQFFAAMKTAAASAAGIDPTGAENMELMIPLAQSLSTLHQSLESIGGVIDWFTGKDDLGTFGSSIAEFFKGMATAADAIKGKIIEEESFDSFLKAAKKLADFQGSVESVGGVIDFFTGRNDLGTFGTNIGMFAAAMGTLKEKMGEDGISATVVDSVINAGTALTELQKALPEEHWLDGKLNLSDFSSYITDFSTAMSGFATTASGINSEAVDLVINTAYRIKNLMSMLVDMDYSGVETFTGIGEGWPGADGPLHDIAAAIADFGSTVSEIDVTAVNTSVSAATRLRSLIAGLVGLDTSGVENFKPEDIGSAIKSYADKVASIDAGLVSSSITSAVRLKTFIAGLSDLDTSGISKFKPNSIGTAMSSYAGSVSGVNFISVFASISVATRIRDFIASLAGLDTGGVGSFVSAINKLGTVSVDQIVESFSGASSKMLDSGSDLIESLIRGMRSREGSLKNTVTVLVNALGRTVSSKASDMMKSGLLLMTSLSLGIKLKQFSVKSSMTSAVSSAASAVRSYYSNFYDAGGYLGSGLVSGIKSKETAVYNAGYRLGQKAVRGEKDGQKSKSPSKLTIQAGKWLGEGLVIGIQKMGTKVYNSGYTLGDTAAKSMSRAVAKVSDTINSGLDAEPTIRPVVDMSDVESSAKAIGGLFGNSISIGTRSNLSAIGSMANTKNQNGDGEVVSAIDKLRKELGNIGGSTYNINGVSYSNDSNIEEAFQTIVRAARIERRS